jgi:hypothetical protein
MSYQKKIEPASKGGTLETTSPRKPFILNLLKESEGIVSGTTSGSYDNRDGADWS